MKWYYTRKPNSNGSLCSSVTPLIHFLSEIIFISEDRSKEEAFPDDFTVARKSSNIKAYWDILQQQGPLFDYFPKPSKSYLIMKEQYYNKAVGVFMGNIRRRATPWCCNW